MLSCGRPGHQCYLTGLGRLWPGAPEFPMFVLSEVMPAGRIVFERQPYLMYACRK